MRKYVLTLALMMGLVFAAPAFAQEDPNKDQTAKPEASPAPAEPAKDEPAKAEPSKEAPPKEAAPATAAPAAAVSAAAAPPPTKELSSCAKGFVPIANSYKSAYDDMEKWIAEIDKATGESSAKLAALQDQIQKNEAAITQAKLAKDNAKAKDLQKENKKLWDDYNAGKKSLSDTCSKYVKDASMRIKQYADATNQALDSLKSQGK
jgi:hypothetical protein